MSAILKGTAVALMAALLVMSVNAWLSAREEQKRLRATVETQNQVIEAADAREKSRAQTLKDELARIDQLQRSNQTPSEIVRELAQYLALPRPIVLAESTRTVSGRGGDSESALQAIPAGPTLELPSPSFDQGDRPQNAAGSVVSPTASRTRAGAYQDEIGEHSETVDNTRPDEPAKRVGTNDEAAGSQTTTSPNVSGSDALVPSADLKPLYNYVQTCRACELRLTEAEQRASDDATKIEAMTRERDAALTAAKGGPVWRRLKRDFVWFAIGAGSGALACYTHSRR